MRTLLILGGLVVAVLLVTPSNGERRVSQDGGEKGTSNLREFIGQNEDGRANGFDVDSSLVHLQSKRQEPSSPTKPRKWKKCTGCFTSLMIDEPIKFDVPPRMRRQEKKKVKKPKTKPTKKPPLPNMYGLTARAMSDVSAPEKPPRGEGRRGKKRDGEMRRREEKEEGKKRRHHHHHHPEEEKEEKKTRRTGSRSPITSMREGRKEDLTDGAEAVGRMKRNSNNRNTKNGQNKRKSGWRSAIASVPAVKVNVQSNC
ncbi:unnamed protein product, partial [Staurois parvus]